MRAAESSPAGDRRITGVELVTLSFGLSNAIVPLLGLALNVTPFGIRQAPIVLTPGDSRSPQLRSPPGVAGVFGLLAMNDVALRYWSTKFDGR